MTIKPFIAKLGVQVGNVNVTNTTINVGANVVLTTFDVTVGNSTVSTIVSNNKIYTGNSTTNSTVNSTGVYVGTSVQNATGFTIGTSVVNSTTIVSGNFTANTLLANTVALNVVNQTNTATLYITTSANVGTATVANTTGIWTTGQVNATSHTTTNFIANNSGVYHTTLMNAASFSVGTATVSNTTGVWTTGIVNAALHSVGTTFTANSTLVNASALNVVNQTNTATLYVTTSANVGANVQLTTSGMSVGNSTLTDAPLIYVQNSTSRANLTSLGIEVGTSVVNSTVISTGSNVYANVTAVRVGNSLVNSVIGNNSITVGNSTVYSVANMSHISLIVGANSVSMNSGVQIYLANSTSNTSLKIPTTVEWSATNVFLHANGSWVTAPYTPPGGANTQIQYNDEGSLGGLSAFTFNKTGNIVTIANTLFVGTGTTNTVVNTSIIRAQSATGTYVYLDSLLGSLVLANTTTGNNITLKAPTTAEKSGNYYLKSDGSWSALSVSAAGSDSYIQYNDGGSAFGGNAGFTFNDTAISVHIGNSTINAIINSTSITFSNTIVSMGYSIDGYSIDYGTY